ncbi:LacI family transcriptional regulator [Thermogemmatispora aurantia]|jgi:LacI family fructose operon transcriptional repressor|uniref:LacI family transcriptional regulator n=1 Tax=Thermogemmatispora aurantia TaxID=2045279 RepID=A0A5J4KCS3_9CHLR|nr:LacI family DNA-binding transcriptional regulator [Thermogemmatispora aurantia]GER85353.1 LacI family transcriptional regulator [Thermogemmatispora aurantia]
MASIKEVARAAGVSTATVSRVLANSPHVRPALRERVLKAIKELEYRPNLIARSLRAQQTTTIGLIVSDIRNPFFTAISRAVEDTAYEEGYSLILCNTDEDPKKESIYLNVMRDANVAGVILSPTGPTAAGLRELEAGFAVVVIDRSIPDADVDMVLLDNVDSAYRLTRHLLENGYQRIAAICGERSTTGRERCAGYEQALRAYGLLPTAELVRFVPPQIEAGYAAALRLLDLPEPPEALLTTNSLLAAGALEAIRERGLRIPDEVALVTFDETTWASLVQPPITLIEQPTYEIGKTATELLLQRVAEPERPTRRVILKGRLLVRGSSAPRVRCG